MNTYNYWMIRFQVDRIKSSIASALEEQHFSPIDLIDFLESKKREIAGIVTESFGTLSAFESFSPDLDDQDSYRRATIDFLETID